MTNREVLAVLIVAALACQPARNTRPMTIQAQTPAPAARPAVPTAIRVVTLGDSLAYGAGDESGKGLAGRLKTELRDRGISDVQTVNLGVNGAQTGDLLARLKTERVRSAIAE